MESLVAEMFGDKYLNEKKLKNEIEQITKEEKSLKRQMVVLGKRRAELQGKLDELFI